jgi:serine/threonine-protein kinase
VVCLGADIDGDLGRGEITGESARPAPVVGLGWPGVDAGTLHDVATMVVGAEDSTGIGHACAIVKPACAAAGSVVCWGNNNFGAVGDGTTKNATSPVRVVAPR